MTRWSGLRWITELLCRLAGIELREDEASAAQSLTDPDQLEAMLLDELTDSADMLSRRMVVLHFAPILESCGSRRDRVVGVIDSMANRAFADHLTERDQHAWVAEALVLRLAAQGDEDPIVRAVSAVFDLAQRLLGSDFDPAVLPARLLVERAGSLVFDDLWPDRIAREQLRELLQQAGAGAKAGGELRFGFRSLWTIETKEILAMACFPQMGGVDLTSDKLAMPTAEAAAIDTQAVARACTALAAAEQGDSLIGIPIHQSTLFDESLRNKALAPYRSLDPALQKRALIEVVCIGADCSRTKLRSSLDAVRGEAETLHGRFHISESNFSDLADAGMTAVGTDVSLSQRAEAELLPMLTAFAKGAEEAGLASYVQGVSSVSLKTGAASAGFRVIEGATVGEASDWGAYPLSPEALYGRSLTDAA